MRSDNFLFQLSAAMPSQTLWSGAVSLDNLFSLQITFDPWFSSQQQQGNDSTLME